MGWCGGELTYVSAIVEGALAQWMLSSARGSGEEVSDVVKVRVPARERVRMVGRWSIRIVEGEKRGGHATDALITDVVDVPVIMEAIKTLYQITNNEQCLMSDG